MVRNASVKRQSYRILEREEGKLTVFVKFQARFLLHVLLSWPVCIPKNKWTKELENEVIVNKIKQLKEEMTGLLSGGNFSLTETEFNILLSLAIEGPSASQSDLWRRRKISRIEEETTKEDEKSLPKAKNHMKSAGAGETIGRKTATQDALSTLESEGLVKIGPPKGVGRSRACDITIRGLFALLDADLSEIWGGFDNIVRFHKSLVPLIFDNWQEFINDKTSNHFKIGIINYFKDPLHSNIASYKFLRNLRPMQSVDQVLVGDLTRHVVFPHLFPYVYELFLPGYVQHLAYTEPFPSEEEMMAWISMVKKHKSLKEYLKSELDRLDSVAGNFFVMIDKWQTMLNAP